MTARVAGIGPIPIPMPAGLHRGAVRLRPFAEGDVDAIARACKDPDIARFTRIPADYGPGDAWAFVVGAEGRRRDGHALDLAVTELPDEDVCGAVGIVVDHFDAASAEIGYWIDPARRGRGLATTALHLLSRWALRSGGFARLELMASVKNTGSLVVAERAGFIREGTARSAWPTPDGRDDLAVFSLLASDVAAEPGGSGDRPAPPMGP